MSASLQYQNNFALARLLDRRATTIHSHPIPTASMAGKDCEVALAASPDEPSGAATYAVLCQLPEALALSVDGQELTDDPAYDHTRTMEAGIQETLSREVSDKRRLDLINNMFTLKMRSLPPPTIRNRAFVFWDLETTGVDVKFERIVQIGAVASTGGRFCMLVNPQKEIQRQAEAVHKISQKMVANQPLFKEVWQDFVRFVKDVEQEAGGVGVILVGHNSFSFDDLMLTAELQRIGRSVSDLSEIEVLSSDTFCAAKAARKAGRLDKKEGLNLKNLHSLLHKSELQGAHDALIDAEAVAKIAVHPTLSSFLIPRPFHEATIELKRRQNEAEKKRKAATVEAPVFLASQPLRLPETLPPQEPAMPEPGVKKARRKEAVNGRTSSVLMCGGCRRRVSVFFEHVCISKKRKSTQVS